MLERPVLISDVCEKNMNEPKKKEGGKKEDWWKEGVKGGVVVGGC